MPQLLTFFHVNLIFILLWPFIDFSVKSAAANPNHMLPSLQGRPVTDNFKTMKFPQGYSNLWGPQHQRVSKDESSVTLTLDISSGSGFKSKKTYMYGFFNAALRLQSGYTAGIITSFYLSNNQVYEGWHDEVNIEFLGTIPGSLINCRPTCMEMAQGMDLISQAENNTFICGFDPTEDFHNYSILWTPHQILFMVDSIPIRRFPKVKSLGVQYPSKPMSVYATIWDASAWATDGGKYKANYSYQPFLTTYTNFMINGCSQPGYVGKNCAHGYLDSFISPKLNRFQRHALQFVRKNYMIYDYCQDFQRYPNGMAECPPFSKHSLLP